jgi:peroxiredoxin/uncharacterized membrane protein YphA (DoxX/SURF4 family)
MDAVDLIGRILLALVFAVSGAAKLIDAGATRRAMRDFGVPHRLAPVAAGALPAVELAIAALVMFDATAMWAAVAAFALLLGFSAAIAWQLARGRHPECQCFGALSAGPIGIRTLARNGGLLALAVGVALLARDDAAVPRIETSEPALLAAVVSLGMALLLGMAVQAVLVAAVAHRLSERLTALDAVVRTSHDRAQRRLAGEAVPPVPGEPAPVLELPDLAGTIVDLAAMRGRALLLVFVRPGCWACDAILPDLAARAAAPPGDGATLVVVSRGSPEENRDLAGLDVPVLLSPGPSVAAAFGVGGTPAVVRLDASGRAASDVVIGIDPVRRELDPGRLPKQEPALDGAMNGGWRRGLAGSTQRVRALVRGGT